MADRSEADADTNYIREKFGIDDAIATSVLDAALSCGGDYAELFFEHKDAGSIVYEQQAVKNATRSLSQGMGVRVLSGEAVGYAYSEDLDLAALRKAADTAAKIAARDEKRHPSTSSTTIHLSTIPPRATPLTCQRRTRST